MVSLVPVIMDLFYSFVFFFSGSFLVDDASPSFARSRAFLGTSIFVGILPFWFRLAQTSRRFLQDRKNFIHLANSGKYSVALFSNLIGGIRSIFPNSSLLSFWIFSAVVSSFYGLYWDIFQDWSLLELKKIESKWLLRVNSRCTKAHFLVAVVNTILRFIWIVPLFFLQSTSIPGVSLTRELRVSIFALLEIYRRCQWNVLRMENEHFNNTGEFRAVAAIPADDFASQPEHED